MRWDVSEERKAKPVMQTTVLSGGESTSLDAMDTTHPHYGPWKPCMGEEAREHCPRCGSNDCYVRQSQPGLEYTRRYWCCKRCGHGWVRRRERTHGPDDR